MAVSLLLGLVYLISELLLTVTRRSRSRTGTKQDRITVARRMARDHCECSGGNLCGETLAVSGTAASSKLYVCRRSAVCYWITFALVGHHHTGPFFSPVDVTIEPHHELIESRTIPHGASSFLDGRAPGVRGFGFDSGQLGARCSSYSCRLARLSFTG